MDRRTLSLGTRAPRTSSLDGLARRWKYVGCIPFASPYFSATPRIDQRTQFVLVILCRSQDRSKPARALCAEHSEMGLATTGLSRSWLLLILFFDPRLLYWIFRCNT